jgi:flagellar protein FliS
MVAQDCARAYRANSVLTASPGQLVLMLYDGALNALAVARGAFDMPAKDIRRFETINKQLSKARNIIAELQGRLDFQAGPEFAEIMHRLYDYYNRRLLEANMRKQIEPIIEVQGLLTQIRDSWAEMLTKRTTDVEEPVLSR